MTNFITYLWDIFRIMALFTGIVFFLVIILAIIKAPFTKREQDNLFIEQDLNDYEERVRELIASGMSEKEAMKKVTSEIIDKLD